MTALKFCSASPSTQRGFSLVELSIVLVVVGLAVAGIFAGRHLLRQSELQEVIKEISSLTARITTFREKYGEAPGDFSAATLTWPSGSTANGNGNGHISNSGGPNGNENFRAWQHLVLAELLEGNYTGIAATGADDYAVVGENIPASSFNSGVPGYYLDYATWHSQTGDVMVLAGIKTNDKPLNSALTPQEASQIDRKLDDGQPQSGIIMADDGADASDNCTTGTPVVYKSTNDNTSCRLIYFYPLNDFAS